MKDKSPFFLMNEYSPPKIGKYRVITNKGKVFKAYYENFLGNDIFESPLFDFDEEVLAWSEIIDH